MQPAACGGQNSRVSTDTCDGLDGPKFKHQWERYFLYATRLALWPTQPPVQLVWGKSGQGVVVTTHPLLVPRFMKEHSYTSTPPLVLHGLLHSELRLSLPVAYILIFTTASQSTGNK
jgi:hypothetical protein